ncbi:transcription factor PCL1 [Cicer arietinum]|uniref:Transcription factor PCL1 n=1 Tax=Cicer arietinum TaxID=3827 RepID=A0A1S2YMR2_CICAR|nr:transcription factor PCL1 [Cicer arietinum]XP_004507165.1 transcription factor PCL1 [Cicer arietinum]
MGEEVRTDEERVTEWEKGLPSVQDLTPLSMALIPPELASAFSISPEPHRTLFDVNRASRNTLSILRASGGNHHQTISSTNDDLDEEEDEEIEEGSGSDSRKHRKIDSATEEADSSVRTETTLKRPRLVWTPQLHKRFVDVVAHLGIKNAVPKTIMQLMNVEGLTRENVASHLQKYRLYLKRMQGLSNDAPSSSDHLFASTPVPQSLHDSANANGNSHSHHSSVPIPMPYPPPPSMMSMPLIGMPHHGHSHSHSHAHMGMPLPPPSAASSYRSHPFNMMHHRDWPPHPHSHSHSHPHLSPNDSNK